MTSYNKNLQKLSNIIKKMMDITVNMMGYSCHRKLQKLSNINKKMMDIMVIRSIINPANDNRRIILYNNPVSMQMLDSSGDTNSCNSEFHF